MTSDIIEKIRNRIPLQTRIYIHLQMEDIENWNNGEYSGKITKDCDEVLQILRIVEDWQKTKAPIYEKTSKKT